MKKLIKVKTDGSYREIKVVSREGKHTFYLYGDISSAMGGAARSCDDFMTFRRNEWNDRATFWWLRDSYGRITGTKEDAIMKPGEFVDKLLFGGTILAGDEEKHSPTIVYCGRKTLKNITAHKTYRKEFSKCLATHFDWYGAKEIRLYDDGEFDLYFEEVLWDGRRGICGGIILHKGETPDQSHYGVHT